jgi:small subunit ribosomal protein S20
MAGSWNFRRKGTLRPERILPAVPNIKAAEKWSRQSEKRSVRNRDVRSRLKTIYKKAAAAADSEGARTVEGAFDKAAAKGVIHPNKAARKKARLAKALRKAAAVPAKTAKGKSAKATRKTPAAKTSAAKTTKRS